MKNNKLIYILIVLLAIWCIGLTVVCVNNANKKSEEIINTYEVNGISTDFTKIVNEKKSSIVSIYSSGTLSSGFIYKQDGEDTYIITSYHGVETNLANIIYFESGYNTSADLIGYNIYADIAVLKAKIPFIVEPLQLADATLTNPGELVISIGTPLALEYDNTVELGMVSNVIRTIENNIKVEDRNITYYVDTIQLSSNLKPGYSGSPVINMNGEVIGVTTMSLDDNFNFAVTANETAIIVDKIIAGEDTKKYQLGIKGTYIKDMPLYERTNLNLPIDVTYGLYVNKLLDNSIALSVGIKNNDVILSINGTKLNNINDYYSIVYADNDSFNFEVFRDGQISEYKVNIND